MKFFQEIMHEDVIAARDSVKTHGFCQLQNILKDDLYHSLVNEARLSFGDCCFSRSESGLAFEAFLSDLGPLAYSYLRSSRTRSLLRSIFGGTYRLVPEKSCFTYYFCGGHLDPHLDDIPGERAVSMLTYLIVESKAADADRPTLDIYSRGTDAPGECRTRIRTSPASLALGYGTEVWHGRMPLREDEVIVMINGSYRLDPDTRKQQRPQSAHAVLSP